MENYPDRPYLHEQMPPSTRMCPSKLLGGMLSTDTCPTALLLCPTLIQRINRYCRDDLDMSEEEVKPILEGDCWQHMRNIIYNGIEFELRSYLHNLLEVYLAIIPYHLQVTCDLDNLCRMCDKEFNGTANYALGHGEHLCPVWKLIACGSC